MVVSETNVLLFQVLSRFPKRSSFVGDGRGCVVGSVHENSFVVVGLTPFGTVVKGWNDFKKFSFKVDMCRFAYTVYEKTLIELKTYVRGLPLEEFDGFLIKMKTLDKVITDFTPPVFHRVMREYP